MRADSFFTNLTKRQSMLLLTAVTFGGSDGAAAFEHLPEDEAEILKERAERLMQVPREKRIPFLVQEIKRLVMGRKGGDLRGADPRQVVEALRGERPALAEVILRALPAQLAEQVRNELPPFHVKQERELKPEILQVIRWHFEKRLEQVAPRQASFLFQDLLNLSAKDLLTLADHLGADEIGPALAGIDPARREGLLKQFSAEQRALAGKSAASHATRKLAPEQASAFLEDLAGEDPRHTVRRAGLRRLVRACLAESPEFASRVAERHRDELGRMLIASIRLVRAEGKVRNGERLKVDVVSRLEHLAERGLVERPVRLAPPPMALRNRVATDNLPDDKPARLPVPRPPQAEARRHSAGIPASRPNHRSEIRRAPSGSALHKMPTSRPGAMPGEHRIPSDPNRPARADPGGSTIHRVPMARPGQATGNRAKLLRGQAAAQARPARPKGDDDA